MAIYNEGGCCGGQQLYVDTDKVAEHVQAFQPASDVLGSALRSHGERANATAENFHTTVLEYQDQDEENASTLRDVVA